MNMLKCIKISGFKSIKNMEDGLELKALNVLIGANGSGKSNFVSFFKLLNFMMTEGLQLWVGREGGANSLLYYGAKVTPQISGTLEFETQTGKDIYHLRLIHAAQDTLLFADEHLKFHKKDTNKPFEASLGAGHSESKLRNLAEQTEKTAKRETARVFKKLLENSRVFHFHDTSDTARIKQTGYIEDNRFLKSDAGNLAARLYLLQQRRPKHYARIVSTIQQIAPFFDDFVLRPSEQNPQYILLHWKERGSDLIFGTHQLSDGTLRFIALTTLLLQPEEDLPSVIVIDEPELGLHPAAIQALGAIAHTASRHSQIIMTTQSPYFLDVFEPEDIIVVSRVSDPTGGFTSAFERLNTDKFREWLDEYTLSELWNKNILGGRP